MDAASHHSARQKPFAEPTGFRLAMAPLRFAKSVVSWALHRLLPTFYLSWSNRFEDCTPRERILKVARRWASVFHRDGMSFGARNALITDQTELLEQVAQTYPWEKEVVLELGCLEGAHTKQLLDLGARGVIGIEGNPEHYIKCLLVREAFSLSGGHFVFADCNEVLSTHRGALSGKVDSVLACGILYHLQNPIETIEHIVSCAPRVVVWTQVASAAMPRGEEVSLTAGSGDSFSGKRNYFGIRPHIGGIRSYSVWLYEEDLLRAFTTHGYTISMLSREENKNGRAVSFVAERPGAADSSATDVNELAAVLRLGSDK